MDDEIIYSWFFNTVEYFDSTPSAAIIVLVDNLESLWSLRSQHDPLGPYISLVNNSIDKITPYWSTLISYPHPPVD